MKTVTVLLFFWLTFPVFPQFDGDVIANWISGPAEMILGDSLAVFSVDSLLLFANGDDTRKLLAFMDFYPTDSELGMITPKGEDHLWYLVLEYRQSGYIPDKDKNFFDTQNILDCFARAEKTQNRQRLEVGLNPEFVVGIYQQPLYDKYRHTLSWGLFVADEMHNTQVRYHMIWLGRRGYIQTQIHFPSHTEDQVLPKLRSVLKSLHFLPGERYQDYQPGDSTADYSLVALMVGKEEAVYAKMGGFYLVARILRENLVVFLLSPLVLFVIIAKFYLTRKHLKKKKILEDKKSDLKDLEPPRKESRIV